MRYLFTLLILFFASFLSAQELIGGNYFTGINANLNYSKKLTDQYSLKVNAEYRSASRRGRFETENRQDFAMGIQRSLNSEFKIAIGGMYRNSSFGNRQRLFQQLAMLQRTLSRVNLVHRIRFDETFASGGDAEYRIRYRFGFDMPGRGYRLDPGEGYIAVLSEFLGEFQGGEYNPELRLATQFGYLFKNSNKGEFEIELRYEDPSGVEEKLIVFGFGYYFNK